MRLYYVKRTLVVFFVCSAFCTIIFLPFIFLGQESVKKEAISYEKQES